MADNNRGRQGGNSNTGQTDETKGFVEQQRPTDQSGGGQSGGGQHRDQREDEFTEDLRRSGNRQARDDEGENR